MLESILIVGGVMLLVAIILSPFYFFRKKSVLKAEAETNYSKMPWWKGMIYALLLGLLLIAVSFYFAVKKELGINLGILGWAIILGLWIFLYGKAKKIKFKKKDEAFGFYLAEEVKKEDFLASAQIVKQQSIWSKKEGLKHIITHLPFVPKAHIGRKDFFFGYLLLMAVGVLLGIISYIPLGKSGILLGIIIFVALSYVVATWFTKRFIDIKPEINAKPIQITLFILLLFVSIFSSIQNALTNEFKTSILSGSLDVSENTFSILTGITIIYAVLGLPLFLFFLFLLFTKGHRTKITDNPVATLKSVNHKSHWTIPHDIVAFLVKHKKPFLLSILSVAAMFVGWKYYDQSQKREVACLKKIEYRGSGTNYKIRDGSKSLLFKTQDEAMNYCLKIMRP